jgi:hypothetical protein
VRLKKGSVGLRNASKGRSDKRRRLPRGKRRKKLTMRRSARESQKVNAVGRRRKSDASKFVSRRGRERRKGLLRQKQQKSVVIPPENGHGGLRTKMRCCLLYQFVS